MTFRLDGKDWPFVREPFEHQRREFSEHRNDRSRALLWRMRTGKSKAIIDLACYLRRAGKIDGVLLFAPNGVHDNWPRIQLPLHMWPGMTYQALAWDSQVISRQWWQAKLKEVVTSYDFPWLCVNSETLDSETAYKAVKAMSKGRRLMLVVDEVDDFRTPGSKRTKRMRGIARKMEFVRILTGTVVHNTPLAAFAQFELLRPGALGFTRFQEFKEHYAEFELAFGQGGRQFSKLVDYRNLEELKAKIAEWSTVVTRDDCPDLPALVEGTRFVHLLSAQQRAYDLMLEGQLREAVEQDPDAPDTPFEAGAKITKLQQIVSGFVVDREGMLTELCTGRNKNPRIEALAAEIEEEPATKKIIWCRFQEDIKRVVAQLRRMGRRPVEYHGHLTNVQKVASRTAFQTDGTVTDFVGQPQAGGRGLDLSAADHVIWYSHTFDNIILDQASERASLIGKPAIALTYLEAPSSVDGYILGNTRKKTHVADDLAGRGLAAVLTELREGRLLETLG